MAKVSPAIRSFNAGETSILVEGRTDIDYYPASNRKMYNTIAAPQGPAITRSGTELVNSVYDHAAKSILIPFVFSETDFTMVEFANLRVRFFTDDGILTYAPVTGDVTDDSPFKIDSATLGANVGDEVALAGFPATYNLNGEIRKITAKVGTVYTLDGTHPALPLLTGISVARVYHIVSPYDSTAILNLRDTPSLDVVYLLNGTIKTYKLKRMDTYDWSFEAVTFVDGPYLPVNEEKTTLSWNVTGKATPNMTTNTLPSGVCSGSSVLAGSDYYMAFDDPAAQTFWQSNVDQSGIIQYQAAAGFICDGYSVHMAINNANASYTSKDYAPSDFTFEGSNNGTDWTILDKQNSYVLYTNNKSVFFKIPNTTSYTYYRLNIQSCTRNGTLKPCVRSLVMRSTVSTSLTITASAVTGINNNQGFKTTDVGRLIRIRGSDQTWRSLVITARSSSTVVTATLLGEPFPDLVMTDKWRLGTWSDTTGYPNEAAFSDGDRLWFFGSTSFPDFFAFSVTGNYENMAPTTEDGTVLDTSAYANRLNARRLSGIKWAAPGKDGMLLGTGSQEYSIKAGGVNATSRTITPANVIAIPSSSRGSSNARPVQVDSQVLFVQRGGRTLREFAYNYEADGYKAPSMSTRASHLGIAQFAQQAYAAEPFSIDWVRRADGTLVGMTYYRDEGVIGWHTHDFSGEVEWIAVMPSKDQLHDVLWMIIKRTIDGNVRRYIEKLTRFWDFDLTIENAHYVDSGLRYEGVPITEVYGLQHLEGETVYGLADGIPVGPLVVTDGFVTLDFEASNIVLGLGYDSEGETARLDNGAQDGTAMGKVKREHNISLNVWQSYGGEVGTWNEDTSEIEYTDLVDNNLYPGDASVIETIQLFSGTLGPITTAPGYEKRGSVFFRRKKERPLPFNITMIMPQMVTQDR